MDPPINRDAVSRFYYGAYHAFRGVIYFTTQGDDHDGHTELAKFIPRDFPNDQLWQNQLKDLRERRNSADYDMYPKSDNYFHSQALAAESTCGEAIRDARAYLSSKGCRYL
jgi:uncharacterized protein (UPF0332 family)